VLFGNMVLKTYTLTASDKVTPSPNAWTGPNFVSGLQLGVDKLLQFRYTCTTVNAGTNQNSRIYLDNVKLELGVACADYREYCDVDSDCCSGNCNPTNFFCV
jgi:hypothetical protein